MTHPFQSPRSSFLTLIGALLTLSISHQALATSRVSVSSNGDEANAVTHYSSVSPDGRFVAFLSEANNLDPADTNGLRDIFLHDFSSRETRLISQSNGGVLGNTDAPQDLPSMADDGSVVFSHTASNLISGDSNGTSDIFLYHRQSQLIERVSLGNSGSQANGASRHPAISPDGRYIAFSSAANNLITGDTNGSSDIFLRDIQSASTSRISLSTEGNEGVGGEAIKPSLSRNGRFIAFETTYALVSDDTNNNADIYLHDRDTGETTRISVHTNGSEGNAASHAPSISEDGRWISFTSRASNLIDNDSNNAMDVFLHDRQNATTRRVSVSGSGAQARLGVIGQAKLAGLGRYVVFTSRSDDLVAQDVNQRADVFVHDRIAENTHLIHQNSAGEQANGDADYYPSISKEGATFVFDSGASNLINNDTNAVSDVFGVNRSALTLTDAHMLWRHAANGEVWMYSLASASLESSDYLKRVRDVQWQIASMDDFNGDGQPDLLWRHQQSGHNWLDMTNQGEIIASRQIARVADTQWTIAGTGDFNADGHSDILWRHQSQGTNWVYLMRNGNVQQSQRLNTVSDLGWQVVGLADFNGDSKTDILWRHASTGSNWIYLLDGTQLTSKLPLNRVPDNQWQVAKLADFDADGDTDILWRHAQNGMNWIYLLDGTDIETSRSFNHVPDQNWQIVGAPDVNADGHADVAWRHARTGENWLYLIENGSLQQSLRLNRIADIRWEVQAIK